LNKFVDLKNQKSIASKRSSRIARDDGKTNEKVPSCINMMRRRIPSSALLEVPSSIAVASSQPITGSSDAPVFPRRRRRRTPSSSSTSRQKTILLLYGSIFILVCLGSILLAMEYNSWWEHPYHASLAWRRTLSESEQQLQDLLGETAGITINSKYVTFVSISDGSKTHVEMGTSLDSNYDAYQMALQQISAKSRNNNKRSICWIKVDVVNRVETVKSFDFAQSMQQQLGRGPKWFYGLALDWEEGVALLPEQVMTQNIMDEKQDRIRFDNILGFALEQQLIVSNDIHPVNNGWKAVLKHRNVEDSIWKRGLHLFQTTSYFIDLDETDPLFVPVYHGHRLFEREDITSEVLIQASKAAGDYLARSIKSDGKMVYMYNPRSDQEADSYNLTRHAGTLYAMACLLRRTQDPNLRDKIQLALNWLLKEHLERCRLPYSNDNEGEHAIYQTRRCIVETNSDHSRVAKLGCNALSLLALSEFMSVSRTMSNNERKNQNDYYMQVAGDLADYIQAAQHSDGSFVQKIQYNPEFQLDEIFYVRYYQGEATFALSRFYAVTGEMGLEQKNEWLQVAQAAARYIVEDSWNVPDQDFVDDHWLLYGLAELYKCDPMRLTPRLLDFAARSVQLVAASQYKEDSHNDNNNNHILDVLDWVGIHHESSSAASTATKSEGLCAVYELTLLKNRSGDATLILDTITNSIRYQLKAQYGPELAMYLRDPQRVLGGIRKGIDSLLMRNDYTQHNLSSFLCLAKVLEHHQHGQSER